MAAGFRSGWESLTLDDQQEAGVAAVACWTQCPIEAAAAAAATPTSPTAAPPASPLAAAGATGNGAKTLREWYLQSADQDPASCALVQRALSRIKDLKGFEQHCATFLGEVEQLLGLLQQIERQHDEVWTKTSALNSTCERLLEEQTALRQQVEQMKVPLEHFNELERIGPLLGVPISADNLAQVDVAAIAPSSIKVHPGSDQFVEVLDRIEKSLSYFEAHASMKDAAAYHAKMNQLYSRALALAKHQVVELIGGAAKAAKAQPSTSFSTNNANNTNQARSFETGAAYAKFRAVAKRVNGLVGMISRHRSGGHVAMLEECCQTYFDARLGLLRPSVGQHLEATCKEEGLMGLARVGSAYLARICQLEQKLFLSFFTVQHEDGNIDDAASVITAATADLASAMDGQDVGSGGLRVMLVDLCTSLYSAMRPHLLHQHDLDQLCQIVAALQEEAAAQKAVGDMAGAAVETILRRLVQDAQERLIYCSMMMLRDQIETFKPSDTDLDYPARLEAPAADSTEAPGLRGHHSLYATWYAPLQHTLVLLSKIYRAVDMSVFEELAGEAVGMCTEALARARGLISAARTNHDGDLFLIKHLLILREQLTPFDINFARVKRRLDFSATRDAFARFVQDRANLFRWSFQSNAFVSLARGSVPTVDEHCVDSKKDMEMMLKTACDDFIARAAAELSGQVSVMTSTAQAFRIDPGSPELDMDAVRAQPFASAERLHAMVESARNAMHDHLQPLLAKMMLYLDNPTTTGILFKPVQRSVLSSLGQACDIIESLHHHPQVSSALLNGLKQLHAHLTAVDFATGLSSVPLPASAQPPAQTAARNPTRPAAPPVPAPAPAVATAATAERAPPTEAPHPLSPAASTEPPAPPAPPAPAPAPATPVSPEVAAAAAAPPPAAVLAEHAPGAPARGICSGGGGGATATATATATAVPTPEATANAASAPTATAAAAAEPAAPATVATPLGGSEDYRAAVVAFYTTHNPEKLDSVDDTLAKFHGREEELLQKLHYKYVGRGVPYTTTPTPATSAAGAAEEAPAAAPPAPPAAPAAPAVAAPAAAAPAAPIPVDYHRLLVVFYTEHNPEKLGSVDSTLAKFQGREEELMRKLHFKYGVPYP